MSYVSPNQAMAKKKKSNPIKLSAIDADLLTVLQYGHTLYGLQILEEINNGRPIPLGFGSLYPALNRLEKKGLVTWKWGDEQDCSGGARRKYYEISGLGATAIDKEQAYRAELARRAVPDKPILGGT